MEIALKYKVKQSNVTYKFLYLPKNYYVCQMIAVRKCHSILLFALLALISSVHIDKVLAWLRFRKVHFLKASFSKTFLQITDINLLPTTS